MTGSRRRRPTLDDVANAVGVSRATVSNAYNRPDQLSADLRNEVLRAAKRLGYAGPNPVARSLATRRAGAIAFMLDTGLSAAFSDPALSITLDALASRVDPEGHALLLLPGGDDGGPRADRVLAAQADLAVAYSLADNAPALRAVRQRGLPLVVIDQPVVPGSARVSTDDRGGATAAARHLLELGHRRFAILSAQCLSEPRGGPLTTAEAAASRFRDNRERLAGYLATLAAWDIAPDSVPIWEVSGLSREAAAPGAARLLDREPTALLCMSDELALAAMAVARQRGLRVPEDLSIVGFDDTPPAAWSDPPLTTVRQDLVRKGQLAGELALLLLAGQRAPKATTLDVELVVRGSTGPAK
ncbi:substrate-binding domain-containing protein [Amycolatopsis endophytica]|uniref:DNA-binding LacI/PurR family transcriptional regulator n=1 Tax=Amycolatopsis endophytica TaxID=860233 RepID=A0A853AVX7_9PSEU|nr:LacI family DNA-binding transcriptional regulator [Amycolatopsis endophytica]NYI86822.1 DNA-binding LacI/PurR family transcriptional regulator [Amycolatopsis endophytica]